MFLVFSFIGYESSEKSIVGKSEINVILKTAFNQLDEVVAIGYGSSKKRDLTGSVASVDIGELSKVPSSNLAQTLSGRVSGVQISTSEGAPGAAISIRVRGGGSITQSNEPLYIIDGFPTEDGLNNLHPSDIESIDVLKDASSTAIYGARGANGVIIVTTKGGKIGQTRVNFDSYYSFKQIAKRLDVMDPLDFVKLEYERSDSDDERLAFEERYGTWGELEDIYGNRPGINWQDEAFGKTTLSKYHKISISGGTKKTKYNVSYGFNDDEGIMVNSGLKRNSANLKFDHEISNKLDAVFSINYTDQEIYGMGTSDGGDRFNKLQHIVMYRPVIGKDGNDPDLVELDEDPALVDVGGNVMQNPIASSEAEHRSREKRSLSMNGALNYKMFKGFAYKLTVGIRTQDERRESFDGERSISAKRNGGSRGSLRHTDIQGYSYSNVLNYDWKLNKANRFNFLVGQEETFSKRRWFQAGSSQFPNDDIGLADLSLGTLTAIPSSYEEDQRLLSFFGRLNYNYKGKYLFTATYRADGSSKFGAGKKYGYFPSASAAWRLVEEPFVKKLNVFSNLKLRLSYGVAGNNRIANYKSLALLHSDYYPLNNVPAISVEPNVLPNPNLQWETTISRNMGLDMGFIDQRIQLIAEFYQTNTKDLLLESQIPMTSGYSTLLRNVGETQNRGFEFSLSTVNISTHDFEWRTDLNVSVNRNKVLELAGTDFFLRQAWNSKIGNDFIVKIGEPVGSMYGLIADGLYQVDDFDFDQESESYTIKDGVPYRLNEVSKPGFRKFKDISGPDGKPDGIVDEHDKTIIGNANPKHFGGITNTFSYKGFDLSVFVNWSYGNDVYNANKYIFTQMHRPNRNVLAIAEDRWMTLDANGQPVTNPVELSALNEGKTFPVWNGNGWADPKFNTWMVEDGSFLRINNITLGYRLPDKVLKRVGVNSMRIYGSLYNVHTFTKYSGYDPDVSSRNSTGVTPGVDFGAYPRSKSLVLGVNVSF